MRTRILTIVGKQRPHHLAVVSLDDFHYQQGDAIDPQESPGDPGRLVRVGHTGAVRASSCLEARRGRARLQGIRDPHTALVQSCADLRGAGGEQYNLGALPLPCHDGLLADSEPWSLAPY